MIQAVHDNQITFFVLIFTSSSFCVSYWICRFFPGQKTPCNIIPSQSIRQPTYQLNIGNSCSIEVQKHGIDFTFPAFEFVFYFFFFFLQNANFKTFRSFSRQQTNFAFNTLMMLNFHAQMTRKSDIGKLQTASSSQVVVCHLFSFILFQHENEMCLFEANQIGYSHPFRRNICGSANAIYADWTPKSYTRKNYTPAHIQCTPVFCVHNTPRFFRFHSASVKGKKNCPALRWDQGPLFPLKKALPSQATKATAPQLFVGPFSKHGARAGQSRDF